MKGTGFGIGLASPLGRQTLTFCWLTRGGGPAFEDGGANVVRTGILPKPKRRNRLSARVCKTLRSLTHATRRGGATAASEIVSY